MNEFVIGDFKLINLLLKAVKFLSISELQNLC